MVDRGEVELTGIDQVTLNLPVIRRIELLDFIMYENNRIYVANTVLLYKYRNIHKFLTT